MRFVFQKDEEKDIPDATAFQGPTISAYAVRREDLRAAPDSVLFPIVNTPSFRWAERRAFRGLAGQTVFIPLNPDHGVILFGITPSPYDVDHEIDPNPAPSLDNLLEASKALLSACIELGSFRDLHIFVGSFGPLTRDIVGTIGRGLGLHQASLVETRILIDEIWIHGEGDFTPRERRRMVQLLDYRWEEPFEEWDRA